MTTDAPATEFEDSVPTGDGDNEWSGTMREVSHAPEIGDRVSEIWHRGDE